MSKHSNFNLIGLFVDKKQSSQQLLNFVNSQLSKQFKLTKRFIFDIGQQNKLESQPRQNQYLLTFNLSKFRRLQMRQKQEQLMFKQVRLFRKKDYNTLYQINTLPKIIKFQNSGNYQKDYIIDWSIFQNMLLLSDKQRLKYYKLFFKGYVFLKTEQE